MFLHRRLHYRAYVARPSTHAQRQADARPRFLWRNIQQTRCTRDSVAGLQRRVTAGGMNKSAGEEIGGGWEDEGVDCELDNMSVSYSPFVARAARL